MVKKTMKAPVIPETLDQKAGITSVEDKVNEIHNVITSSQPAPKKEKKKRVLSEEAKDALRERLIKARAVRASKLLAKK